RFVVPVTVGTRSMTFFFLPKRCKNTRSARLMLNASATACQRMEVIVKKQAVLETSPSLGFRAAGYCCLSFSRYLSEITQFIRQCAGKTTKSGARRFVRARV